MSRADQFAIGVALVIVALTAIIHNIFGSCLLLLLGLVLIGRIYYLDYRWGKDRPTLKQIHEEIHADEYKVKLENPKFERWVNHITNRNPWRRRIFPITVVSIVAAFAVTELWPLQDWNQWVLENYSVGKGYTFIKSGTKYEAQCKGFLVGDPRDTNGTLLGSGVQLDPQECSRILPYMHKAIPFLKSDAFFPDRLVLPVAQDGTLKQGAVVFTIIKAE